MHVPEGWEHTIIEEYVDLLSGYPFKSQNYSDDLDDVLLLRGDNIEPGSLRWRDAKRWSIQEVSDLKKYELEVGDFVIAMDRTWISSGLKVAEVKASDIPCLLVQRVSRIRAKKSFSQSLLKQIFSTHRFAQYVKGVQTETAVPHISAAQIKEFPVLAPPLPEQQKIAQILSTWDKAIEKLEALIAAKQKRKKALMQQLLTGKKRFSGFEGEWRDFHLVDVSQILVSPVDKKTIEGERPVLLCNYTDVYYNIRITKALPFMRATATEKEISKFKLREGDVIITKDSETPGDIAIPAYVSEDLGGVVCGYHLAILRPKKGKLDGEFLNYLLSMPITRYYFFTLANGATRFGLSVGGIEKAHFHLPPIEEQQKIASVLSTADREIENHQNQLSALKQQKKGLMQQLLTGKKRVKLDEPEQLAAVGT